ncbi:hypothetical protein Ddye_016907 [Dipteronia dyeriana]|uniref:Dephospho-CoA kinase n=1 Tax=Dipteronia dyeriana TaxID=168575 RepID=A0AAD9U8C2_9ROSI|nr:hypothetical protein Ddye_016907 [Dipteronia dyeriana]
MVRACGSIPELDLTELISVCALGLQFIQLNVSPSIGLRSISNIYILNSLGKNGIWLQDVLKRGTGGWKKVVATFGEDILLATGEVDRPKLGQIVFSDPDKRQLLNRLLAPYISTGIFMEILKLWIKGFKVIVLDVPLLFEAKMDKWTKPIVVIWVDPEIQLQRLMERDRTSEEDAKTRINAQMPLDIKITKADIVIDNNGSLDDLNEQFRKVLSQVTRPFTWTEFWLSRQGALSALVSVIVGVVICRKVL